MPTYRSTLPPFHKISPNGGGWFDVESGRSSKWYKVTVRGVCTHADGTPCEGFKNAGRCSHVEAVREVSGRILAELKK